VDVIEEESENSMEEEEDQNGSGEEEEGEEVYVDEGDEDLEEGDGVARPPGGFGFNFGMIPEELQEAIMGDSGEEDEDGDSMEESGGSEDGSDGSGSRSSRSSSQSHDDDGDNGRPPGEPRVFRLRRLAEQIDYTDPSSFIRCLEDEVIAAGYVNIARPDALHKLEHVKELGELEQKRSMQLDCEVRLTR
jgi:hypothetical protein